MKEKIKVGIITVHRAYNYGSVLQCYALQEILKKLGYETWVIDYRQRWTETVYKPFSLYFIIKKIRHPRVILSYLRSINTRREKYRKKVNSFKNFRERLHVTDSCNAKNIPQDFDCYIIGSDQLWSLACVGGEDPIYFGDFKHKPTSHVVAYAISTNLESLRTLGKSKINEIIKRFDKISMREEFAIEQIKEYTGKTLSLAIDPTLLIDPIIWIKMINTKWQQKRYVAIYQARSVQGCPTYLYDKANILAKKYGLDIIDLSDMSYTVEDFISIIKFAKCVMTTSFHATVFSILMETPFYAIKLNDGFDDRYVNLLQAIDANEALVEKDFIPEIKFMDFNKIKNCIKQYREKSLDFLQNI